MHDNALWIALAAALLVWFVMQRLDKIPAARARQLVAEEGALLVDVRTPGEFAGGHLPGALNVPIGALDERAAELAKKGKPIVVYCASGMRSGSARRVLQRAGATVFDLGAMSRW
jgi:phage shock protein E